MIKLRLACEYLAGPVFCPDPDRMGHMDLEDLPLSNELRMKIIKWDSDYQALFDDDNPGESGFPTPEAELRHIADGQELAESMQKELRRGYIVEYCP